MSSYKIGKGISKSWVDSQYGGMSGQSYSDMVVKYNNLLKEQFLLEGLKVAAASSKPYSGQEYPQPTTVSAPPGYKEHQPNIPPGALQHPGLSWEPNTNCGQLIDKSFDKFESQILKKEFKIFVDPTFPEEVMVTVGANGMPVLIQLQKIYAAALKQGSD